MGWAARANKSAEQSKALGHKKPPRRQQPVMTGLQIGRLLENIFGSQPIKPRKQRP